MCDSLIAALALTIGLSLSAKRSRDIPELLRQFFAVEVLLLLRSV